MSWVTNIILSTPPYFGKEKEEIEKKINSFFEKGDKGFVNCDDKKLPTGWYGGTKMLEAELWIGAFNYINLEDLVEHLENIDWGGDYEKEEVQLIIKDQDDKRFRILNLFPIRVEEDGEGIVECAFCGEPTKYFSPELVCYICPKCLGEYRKALAMPVYFDDYQTNIKIKNRGGKK